MTELQQAINAISDQQKSLKETHPAFCVGEQLKDIIATTPGAAELVLQDLKAKGMGLVDCEKQIEAYARANKEGNRGCCPPTESDRIIRKFYGLPTAQKKEYIVLGVDLAQGPDFSPPTAPAPQKPKRVNFADFL